MPGVRRGVCRPHSSRGFGRDVEPGLAQPVHEAFPDVVGEVTHAVEVAGVGEKVGLALQQRVDCSA